MFEFGPEDRVPKFKAKIEFSSDVNGCWNWTGFISDAGYGLWDSYGTSSRSAHRISYEWTHGSIDKSMVLDHLCKNRKCVNPDHLEEVTYLDNIMRGEGCFAKNARKTHCPKGHPLDGDNLTKSHLVYNRRSCNTCHLELLKKRREIHRENWVSTYGHNAQKTHCSKGHAFTEDNLVKSVLKYGERKCKTCLYARKDVYYRKKQAAKGKTVNENYKDGILCKRGHPYDEGSVVHRKDGTTRRVCRTCKANGARQAYLKRKAAKQKESESNNE